MTNFYFKKKQKRGHFKYKEEKYFHIHSVGKIIEEDYQMSLRPFTLPLINAPLFSHALFPPFQSLNWIYLGEVIRTVLYIYNFFSELRRATIPIFFDMIQCEYAAKGNFMSVSTLKRISFSGFSITFSKSSFQWCNRRLTQTDSSWQPVTSFRWNPWLCILTLM